MSIKFACQLHKLMRHFRLDFSLSSTETNSVNNILLHTVSQAWHRKTAQIVCDAFVNQAVSFLNVFHSPGGIKAKNFSVFV